MQGVIAYKPLILWAFERDSRAAGMEEKEGWGEYFLLITERNEKNAFFLQRRGDKRIFLSYEGEGWENAFLLQRGGIRRILPSYNWHRVPPSRCISMDIGFPTVASCKSWRHFYAHLVTLYYNPDWLRNKYWRDFGWWVGSWDSIAHDILVDSRQCLLRYLHLVN